MTGPQGMGPVIPGGGVPGSPGGGPGPGDVDEGGITLPAGCNLVLNEAFNSLNRWTIETGSPTIVAGRNGTAVNGNSGARIRYTIPVSSRSDTVTLGFAWRRTDSSGNPKEIFRLLGDDGTVHHSRLTWSTPTGMFSFDRGTSGIASSAAGAMAGTTNTWYYIEAQIKLHDTAGFVKIRVDNSIVINATGLDTKNAGTGTVFDTLLLAGEISGAVTEYDDLYFTSGSTCLFQGDHKISGPCKLVLNEPFNNFTTHGWTFEGVPTIIAGGRNGTAANCGPNEALFYPIASTSQSDTITLGFALKHGSMPSGNFIFGYLGSDYVSPTTFNNHIVMIMDDDNHIEIRQGGVAGTLLINSSADLVPDNVWTYVEIQAKLHNTLGSVSLRVNDTLIGTATNVDTFFTGGVKTVWDHIRFRGGSNALGGPYRFDDVYLTAGPGCSFQGDHVPGAACVTVLNEPFDNLSKWGLAGAPAISPAGRNGTALTLTSGSSQYVYYDLRARESDWVTVGAAFKFAAWTVGHQPLQFRSDNGATLHVNLNIDASGSLTLRVGSVTIGTYATPLTLDTWYYIETKVHLEGTNGSGVVRVNDVTVISVNNIDTTNAGTKTVVDQIRIQSTGSAGSWYVDDLYITAGAGCSFQGDHPVLRPCTEILRDPMETFSNFVITGGTPTLVTGRNGTAHRYSSTGPKTTYQIPADKQSSYLMLGFAAQCNYLPSGGYPVGFRTAAGTQGKLSYNSSGGVTWAKWTAADNPSGVNWSSAAGFMTPDAWHYIEIYIYLHATAGFVLVAVDEVTAINVTGINTLGHGTDTAFNRIEFGAQVTTINLVDDVYVRTGFGCSLQGDHPIVAPTEAIGWNATGTGSTAVIGPFPGVKSGDVVALYLTSNRNGATTAGRPTISKTDPADSNSQWRWKDGTGIDAPTGGYSGRSLPYRHDVWLHTIQGIENDTTTWTATWSSSAEWVYVAGSFVQGCDITSWVRFTSVTGGSGSTIRPDYVCPENPSVGDIPDRSRCFRTIATNSTVLTPVIPSNLTKITEAPAIPEWQDFTIFVDGTVYAPTEATVKFPEVAIHNTGGGPIFYTGTLGCTTVIVRTFPVTINLSGGQSNPATTAPIWFDVHFDEPVTGFNSSDISIHGDAWANTITIVGSGTDYVVSLSDIELESGVTGTMIVTIPGSTINSDTTGLPNAPSTSTNNSVAFTPSCNLVLNESFNNLSKWTGSGAIVSGRNGTAVEVYGNSWATYHMPTEMESQYMTVGFAFRWVDPYTTGRYICQLLSGTVTPAQNRIAVNTTTGVISVTNFNTVIATSTSTSITSANTWYYFEVQAKLADTDGFITIRVNGVQVLSFTGDTQNAHEKTGYDGVELSGSSAGFQNHYDDLYLTTGADCAFQGDHAIS